MKIVESPYIYIDGRYERGLALLFGEEILDIATPSELKRLHPDIPTISMRGNGILFPGFVNPHVHLEFSANRSILRYGDFIDWLYSVIECRDILFRKGDEDTMRRACEEMLSSGITTFGAISSNGKDLGVCRETVQKVIYFNEAIGSSAEYAETIFEALVQRVHESRKDAKRYSLTPAVAIHSPYSVHPSLLEKAVGLAREEGMPLTAHFMESSYEREWLDTGRGGFAPFFEKFFGRDEPTMGAEEFLEKFDGYPTLFVHCTHASDTELERMKRGGDYIAHCPRSNRLLGCGRLEIENIEVPITLATDGYSSNYSLNIFDEMRSALMMHCDIDPLSLADRLIASITATGAKSVGSDAGRIEIGAPADMVFVELPEECDDTERLSLDTILHTKEVSKIWIDGEEIALPVGEVH